ncbi:MAG: Rpp14/Pop5 family protein [Nitrososphaerota archaeon]|uniref:Rpp14/Pop5 family protein n=1 Tax=Candidatus Bathycorpusculum sp. TaxID=2994959 RepID=UPI00281C0CD3|nr:Rpp14/Pop5 family protein [Candidatus Termitimicrobium sp.]MCL2431633.1 Rpp14/Pop5 family protein [Candidatus Termitimicrobium sp.]MDR0493290.1 Rpp14/Pop5 family protein [Nitrososphaerota archaeon]
MKRTKRRYLALQLECAGLPSEREFMDALWDSITKLYGEIGASLTGLSLIDFDSIHKVVVVRVSLASLPSMRASLATVTSVAGFEASVHVLSVSGTLKALFSNF